MKRILTLLNVFFIFCSSSSISGQTTVLNDFETGSPAVVTRYGGGSIFSVINNPNSSGFNTTAKCAKIARNSTNWYLLFGFNTSFTIPANTKRYLHMKVNYAAQPDISIRINAATAAADGSADIRALNKYTNLGTWQDLVFEMDGGVSGRTVTALLVLPDIGFNNLPAGQILNNTDKFGYIDDIVVNNISKPFTGFSWTGTTSSDWTVATNWSSDIVPNQNSDVTIVSTANQPTIATDVTINSLTIASGATLNASGNNLTVTGAIANSGSMNLGNNCNLIQAGLTNTNTGNITVARNSNALSRLDFTIWSSPVTNSNQFLSTFSPLTSTNRFYNYNETTNLYNEIANSSATPFDIATGYLIRIANTHPTAPTIWNGSFSGVPNNGTINKAITYNGTTFGYNMVGNPYPSTISADVFINANTANIESSLYFWRKTNGAAGTAYATYNSVGPVATGSGLTGTGSETPNGTIQVGQGFFVKAKSASNLTFTNAMRLGTTSTQFFKTKQVAKDRLWLNLTNTSGAFSQALVGYLADATQGVDSYDAKYINDSPLALTSNINNEEYTIQGRPAFEVSDLVALNFKTDMAGDYTIALDHFDGLFDKGQDVYLKDNTTGAETDLKMGSYTFNTIAGVFNSRFSIKYQKTLKIEATEFSENNVRVYKNKERLYINSDTKIINSIQVYDIQGKLIAEQNNVNATSTSINNLKAFNQVLIVKIVADENKVITKKLLN